MGIGLQHIGHPHRCGYTLSCSSNGIAAIHGRWVFRLLCFDRHGIELTSILLCTFFDFHSSPSLPQLLQWFYLRSLCWCLLCYWIPIDLLKQVGNMLLKVTSSSMILKENSNVAVWKMEVHVVVPLRIVAATVVNTTAFRGEVMFHSIRDVANHGSLNVPVRHVYAPIYVEARSKCLDDLWSSSWLWLVEFWVHHMVENELIQLRRKNVVRKKVTKK